MTIRLGRGEDNYEALKLRTMGEGAARVLNVQEDDGDPTVTDVNTIIVDNGTLTDEGSGVVRKIDYDAAAIHDNEADEISAITEKTVPVSADMIIIEDSEASNIKKMVQIGNLTAGGVTGATQIGQVLYSVDGVIFTAELPITDEAGWLVEETSGILIVA
jgi:hypothetical protein